MTKKTLTSEFIETETTDFHVGDHNSEVESRRARLRAALRLGGGNKVVAEKSGIPIATLGGYVAGGEVKLSNLIAIARACGVNVGWLAAGEGPVTGELQAQHQAQPEPQKTAEIAPIEAFAVINVDRMASALEAAAEALGRQGKKPATRRLVQVALLLYDESDTPEGQAQALIKAQRNLERKEN